MITVTWFDETFTADKAVRGPDYVALYDDENNELKRIHRIFGHEWDHISIEGGDWSNPEDIPTAEEILRADVDFLTMENEYLESENEVLRADVDYCLMLLEE